MTLPVCDIDFYSDEVIRDPYPFYEQLRAMGPVVYLSKNDLYALPCYKEVSEVLRQPLRYISSKGVSPIQRVNDILVGSTLNSDPPQHDLTRSVTSEPLLPGALAEITERIETAADGLVDTLCKRGTFDAIKDFAQFLPVTIVAELVGLPQAVSTDQMLRWASATFNLFGTENARTDQAFHDLKNLRDFLLEYGRPEKLKSGGWAKRIFEVGPERGISPQTCAQLMRDYINPSLDTTISTSGQILKFFADHPDQWTKIRNDATLIPNAVEEAVRMATPIRAFTRFVNESSEIAGHKLEQGTRVLVIYASANRDPAKFADPDQFDVTRDVHDHVGFGQGVHMCMGMHLARLEIVSLLKALRLRVDRFEIVGTPEVAYNNSIRAYARLPVRVTLSSDVLHSNPADQTPQHKWLDVQITRKHVVAKDIMGIELSALTDTPLPRWDAGAHVDVLIRSGLVRQYSLTGDPRAATYHLGILRDPKSRGGSQAVHETFEIGQTLRIGVPRNHFPLNEQAEQTLLFAGGIGITPMLAMAHRLTQIDRPWTLHYCVRSRDSVAFRDQLAEFGDRVVVHCDDGPAGQRLDLTTVLSAASHSAHVYVCGPNGFMDFVTEMAQNHGLSPGQIHLERFGAEIDTKGAPFQVIATKSNLQFTVAHDQTIADQLAAHGVDVAVSCQSGVCGTCLTPVIEGKPDHRDLVQTDLEKASNTKITVCCSRSFTKTLVLEI